MVVAGRVTALHRYPVKSMQGEALDSTDIGENGIPLDRAWAVREVASDRVLTAKRAPLLLRASAFVREGVVMVALEDAEPVPATDPGLSARLSRWLGLDVRLEAATSGTEGVYEFQTEGDPSADVVDMPVLDGTFFDCAPLHLLTTSSLAAAAASDASLDWDVRRFRPTVMVETEGPGFVEDAWVDSEVTIGGLRCEVLMPTIRCAMPMASQPGLPAAPTLMSGLKTVHRALLGVYATVLVPGMVRVGDMVSLES